MIYRARSTFVYRVHGYFRGLGRFDNEGRGRGCSQGPRARRLFRTLAAACTIAFVIVTNGACEKQRTDSNSATDDAGTDRRVVVYCSVDEVFARDVLGKYEQQTGQRLAIIGDSEAGKTTGLVNRIIGEAKTGRPRADVFWSSEIFNTILLARQGLLESYDSPAAADIPERFRDAQHRWTATSVRARVLAFDPSVVNTADLPKRWEELADPKYAAHTAIANPLFGTTRGHVAAMFALWGEERGRRFLTNLRDNGAMVADGNSSAVRAVIAKRVRFAMTDTDDVWVAQRSGASLDLRYLDMGDGGTLVIPCTVSLIKGGPNHAAARKLVDYLVSAEVERLLAQSDSRNVPVRESLRRELGIDQPPQSKVAFDAVADAMDSAVAAAREILLR